MEINLAFCKCNVQYIVDANYTSCSLKKHLIFYVIFEFINFLILKVGTIVYLCLILNIILN